MAEGDGYTVQELARTMQNALARMESLAARLEGGQFVSAEVHRLSREAADAKIVAIKAEVGTKVDTSTFNSLQADVTSLKEDRKYLVRLLVTFVVLAVLGLVFTVSGGVPK